MNNCCLQSIVCLILMFFLQGTHICSVLKCLINLLQILALPVKLPGHLGVKTISAIMILTSHECTCYVKSKSSEINLDVKHLYVKLSVFSSGTFGASIFCT